MTVLRNQVSADFTSLNALRPLSASFAEVVSIELWDCSREWYALGFAPIFGDGPLCNHLGTSKRKSIHVLPSSNAYWNFVNLRSLLIGHFNSEGWSRIDRSTVVRLLNLAVRWTHLKEMELTYGSDEDCIQYYRFILARDPSGFLLSISRVDLGVLVHIVR